MTLPNNEDHNTDITEHVSFQDDTHLHSLSCSMSVEEFHSSLKKMSSSQLEVLNYVKSKFEQKEFPFYVFISGGAGVGKTF